MGMNDSVVPFVVIGAYVVVGAAVDDIIIDYGRGTLSPMGWSGDRDSERNPRSRRRDSEEKWKTTKSNQMD
jgi:hypothetical protein